MSGRSIQGFCPSCGRRSLHVPQGQHELSCYNEDCDRPTAAQEILNESETEHIVLLEAESFSIQHPLRERLDGELFQCPLHAYIAGLDGPPHRPGRWRVSDEGATWELTASRD